MTPPRPSHAPPVPPAPVSSRRMLARLWVLMATVSADMIGFLIVLPLLPFYAERFGATPATVGYLVGAFALAQLLTAPLWGLFSDRFGRRPMILLGLGTSAAAFALFGLAEPIAAAIAALASPADALRAKELAGAWGVAILFFSRVVQGAGGGTTGVVQAYVADSVEPGQRAKALGWVTAATSAGVMIGPVLGSQAFRLGHTAPGLLAAGLCLLNLAFAWRLLPEPERRDEHGDLHPAPSSLRGSLAGVVRRPAAALASLGRIYFASGRSLAGVVRRPTGAVASLIWIYAVGMMAFMAMNAMLALYLNRTFGVTEENIGWFYTYVGGVSLVMRALLLGPIVARLGEVRTLRVGLACLAAGMAVLPLPRNLVGFGLVVVLVPVGTALLFPATTSLVAGLAARRQTGETLGVQQTFGGIARLVGPFWSGLLFQYFGVGSPFWVAAALVAAAGLFSLKTQRGEPAGEVELAAAAAESAVPGAVPIEPS
jgi:MFS family permease